MEPPQEIESRQAIGKLKHILSFILELNWFLSASAGLVAFLLVKRYGYDIVKVNADDMRATLRRGDAVLVKKFANELNTGDLLYFRHPLADTMGKTLMIQRVFGLPGDTLEIRDKAVYLNGMRLSDTGSVKHNYFIITRKFAIDSAFRAKYRLNEGGAVSDENDYSYSLTGWQAAWLRKDTLVESVTLKSEKRGAFDGGCFPGNANFRWNRDHYGPLRVPAINDTLLLDTVSIGLYASLIRHHEKNILERRGDTIVINGQPATRYVVKKNYYFVLGDNRDNANDSRAWGFLPGSHIEGKVIRLLRRPE